MCLVGCYSLLNQSDLRAGDRFVHKSCANILWISDNIKCIKPLNLVTKRLWDCSRDMEAFVNSCYASVSWFVNFVSVFHVSIII